MSELPSGWGSVNLFEICRPRQWKTISTRDLLPSGYVVYGANGEIGFYSEYTHENPTAMITCRGATCGNIHISKPFSYINGNAMALDDLNESISGLRYVNYFLRSRGFEDVISGSAQPQITGEGLRKVSIPIAPLPEQKRIADKLDAVLARVDACRDRLDRIPSILKRFRQSVLAAATSGKLTEDWRANQVARMQPQAESGNTARDSAQSHYVVTTAPDSAALHPGYEAWKKTNVGALLTDIRYGTSKKCHYEPKATPVIRIPNVCDGQISHDDMKYADFDGEERKKLSLVAGDILMIRSNGSVELVGRTALATKEDEGFLYAGYLIRLRVNHLKVNSAYLSLALSTPDTRNAIELTSRSTSGVNNINTEEIKAINIGLPDLAEQTEIVRRVEALFAYADRLEARHQAARAQVEKLTPATLAKAFRGELVQQDPNDEPASVLLERIRTKHNDQSANKPKRERQNPQTKMIA